MPLTSTRWLLIKQGTLIVERLQDFNLNSRNAQQSNSVLLKSAVNLQTLKILDKGTEEKNQNANTIGQDEIDLKDELRKVLGLKEGRLRSLKSTVETKRESIKASK